jgi:DNA-binding IclR family transcriptional regulator
VKRHSPSRRAAAAAPTGGRFGVQSVEIAARVLKALAAEGGPVPLKRLATATAMPRAKVHRYLVSLCRAGLVAQDAGTGHYSVGPLAVTAGLAGLRAASPLRRISEALPALRDAIDETVTVAIWTDGGPTVVAIEESSHVVTMNVRVGSLLPLLSTAIGRLFAAYLPPGSTRRLIGAERRAGRGAGLPSEAALAREIREIRRQGLSRGRSALLPGVDAIAAPVFDHRGTLIAVICAVGRSESMDTSWTGAAAGALRRAAAELSRQFGYTPGSTEAESRDALS